MPLASRAGHHAAAAVDGGVHCLELHRVLGRLARVLFGHDLAVCASHPTCLTLHPHWWRPPPQIVGLTPTAGCFFIYLLVTWSASNSMGARCSQPRACQQTFALVECERTDSCTPASPAASLFRMFGFAGKTMVIANSTAMLVLLLMVRLEAGGVPFVSSSAVRFNTRCQCSHVQITTNGFSIVYPSIPKYMIWLYCGLKSPFLTECGVVRAPTLRAAAALHSDRPDLGACRHQPNGVGHQGALHQRTDGSTLVSLGCWQMR